MAQEWAAKTNSSSLFAGHDPAGLRPYTRTKDPTDITVGAQPINLAVTPDGKTVFVANYGSDTISTIDVKSGTKDPTGIPVGSAPGTVSVTPCRR